MIGGVWMSKGSDLGRCIVSNNILHGIARLKWCFREESISAIDNGWRFLSEIDTDAYLSDPKNLSVCDYNKLIEIEPAIVAIYDMPIGTDVTLMQENNKKFFVYNETGDKVNPIH